jgi:hypothetical protein
MVHANMFGLNVRYDFRLPGRKIRNWMTDKTLQSELLRSGVNVLRLGSHFQTLRPEIENTTLSTCVEERKMKLQLIDETFIK